MIFKFSKKLEGNKKESAAKQCHFFRYRDALDTIAKISSSKEICISAKDGQVYKIGFVLSQQEMFTWELPNDLSMYDLSVNRRDQEVIHAIKRSFIQAMNKESAIALLQNQQNASCQSARFSDILLN